MTPKAEYEAVWDQYEIDIAAYIAACQQIDGGKQCQTGATITQNSKEIGFVKN